jgi:hypothetical protein
VTATEKILSEEIAKYEDRNLVERGAEELWVNLYIDTYRYLPTRQYTIQMQVDISI